MNRSGRDLFEPRMGLSVPLSVLHLMFFFLYTSDSSRTLAIFAFHPERAFLAPWSFITYQFLHQTPLSVFFGALATYILGSGLEAEWGTREFTFFWLVGTLGGSFSAWILGEPLYSDSFTIASSMLFAYAYLFPDVQFFVFYVIPVRVKWIALLTAAFVGFMAFDRLTTAGPGAAFVGIAGAASGFFFFWIRHHGRFHLRRAAREAVQAVKSAGAIREDATLERRNRELFPRVETLREAARQSAASGTPLPTEASRIADDLAKLVVPGVNICKPVDFKGDKDDICVRCEGFAECSLRYVAGKPAEIVVKKPD